MTVLTAQEIEKSRKIFTTFDKDGEWARFYRHRLRCSRRTHCCLVNSATYLLVADVESGTIDVQELRAALQLLGQQPTLEELFIIISQVSFDKAALPLN